MISKVRKPIYSLALSVYFKQPKFGMKKYEILSRASAFLLSVEPSLSTASNDTSTSTTAKTKYPHLEKSIEDKKQFEISDNYTYEPAGGPVNRKVEHLNWLEFIPKDFRPVVHVISSSHVISPWRFPQYYGQDWIQEIKQEHCSYSLDVIKKEGDKDESSLARFALNPYPIHHPADLDLAVIHLKHEEAALKHMQNLGVNILHLREDANLFKIDEPYLFDGYEITQEDNSLKELDKEQLNFKDNDDNDDEEEEEDNDNRVFIPFQTKGALTLFSPNRFIASTGTVLPQGVCGGPVIQQKSATSSANDDICCGIVEGIVPQTHEDKRLAGSAAFIPSHTIKHFIDAAEEFMVKQIVPEHLYQAIIKIKQGHHSSTVDGTTTDKPNEQQNKTSTANLDPKIMEKEYNNITQQLQDKYSPEIYKHISDFIEKQRQEVIDIVDTKGGDLDDIMRDVTQRSIQKLKDENLMKHKLLEEKKEETK